MEDSGWKTPGRTKNLRVLRLTTAGSSAKEPRLKWRRILFGQSLELAARQRCGKAVLEAAPDQCRRHLRPHRSPFSQLRREILSRRPRSAVALTGDAKSRFAQFRYGPAALLFRGYDSGR